MQEKKKCPNKKRRTETGRHVRMKKEEEEYDNVHSIYI